MSQTNSFAQRRAVSRDAEQFEPDNPPAELLDQQADSECAAQHLAPLEATATAPPMAQPRRVPVPPANGSKPQGAHVRLEAGAISAARRCIAAVMEYGPVGPLDMPSDAMPTQELVTVASIARAAWNDGRRGWPEVLGFATERAAGQAERDTIRTTIADFSQEMLERPEALEHAAGIVLGYHRARTKQHLSWRLTAALESGEDTDPILAEIAGLEAGQLHSTDRKPLCAFLVNHAETLGMSWEQIDGLRPPYVIDQFVRRGEVLLEGAESKSRKSWLAQDAGFSVAAGAPWLADENGENGFAVAQAGVHVLDLELNPAEMRFRFAKARGNRFADDPQEQARVTSAFHSYSFDGLNVVDILPRIAEVQPTVQPGDLVIVDCLYRLAPDGNEVAPLAAILETIKRFAAETQSAVIVVDHFRKAGDDKARNRFAGSFIKQASASTLVAIEARPDDLLEMNIDARTFHGCPKVHARFDCDSYTFRRVPDSEVADAKQGREQAEAEGWLVAVWKSRPLDYPAAAQDGVDKWGMSRQSATKRFDKLAMRGETARVETKPGAASQWILTPKGAEIVKISLNLHP